MTTHLFGHGFGGVPLLRPPFLPGYATQNSELGSRHSYLHCPYLWLGYVEGYARRFWQGNETHRGQPGQPGRVATLVEEAGTSTYGLSLELKGEDALEYLNNRNGDRAQQCT